MVCVPCVHGFLACMSHTRVGKGNKLNRQNQLQQPYVETTNIDAGEQQSVGLILVAIFVGAGALLIGWGIWDLLSSAVAQAAFATAIVAIGYGFTALLVAAGAGVIIYATSYLIKALAPYRLARGVQQNGGVFRGDGVVLTLPDDFGALPGQTQEDVIRAFTGANGISQQQLPLLFPTNKPKQTATIKRDWRGS